MMCHLNWMGIHDLWDKIHPLCYSLHLFMERHAFLVMISHLEDNKLTCVGKLRLNFILFP